MNSYFKSILKISIPSDDISDITLLSSREARNLPKNFLPASSTSKINWWLRTAGSRGRVAFVDGDGDINIDGQNVYYDYGVRPALEFVSKSYMNNLELGDIVVCLSYAWIYAGKQQDTGKDLLLFLTVLDNHCFNADIEKPGANFFVGSDIQKYLREWLKKAKKTDNTKYSAYSSMTQKIIRLSDDFDVLKKAIKTHLENEEEDAADDEILILDNHTGKYKII